MNPNVITNLSEHFPQEAAEMQELHGFVFKVAAFRKVSKGEMVQSFRNWKNARKGSGIPKNKTETLVTVIGFDGA